MATADAIEKLIAEGRSTGFVLNVGGFTHPDDPTLFASEKVEKWEGLCVGCSDDPPSNTTTWEFVHTPATPHNIEDIVKNSEFFQSKTRRVDLLRVQSAHGLTCYLLPSLLNLVSAKLVFRNFKFKKSFFKNIFSTSMFSYFSRSR